MAEVLARSVLLEIKIQSSLIASLWSPLHDLSVSVDLLNAEPIEYEGSSCNAEHCQM